MDTDAHPIPHLMRRFGRREDFARAVGVNLSVAHKWAQRRSIPTEWQERVVRAAQDRGFDDVTAEWMLAVHSREARAA